MKTAKNKIILAITGASGAIYAHRLLEKLISLREPPDSVAVIFSDTATEIWEHEIGSRFQAAPPAKLYKNDSFYAPFASGSSDWNIMIVCPASMGTLGRIANGVSDDLICRAADVMLKEKRRLIVVPRETPYNLVHLRNMETLALAGAVICPATPSFYRNPSTIDDLVMTVVERIIALAGFENDAYRWMGND
ncbi:MAG: UbiX family flavin prenyltransferase [Bacteroidales bacterium]|jgi:4-hydroxy-3-polyprenylbenzoate decarboxylase|nr:UbiX family flavin prenyltransferase [Bacteroidales bacterium]HOW10891.1 UbiX family flavin prenyltransferase [Bacteroidales bacterium]